MTTAMLSKHDHAHTLSTRLAPSRRGLRATTLGALVLALTAACNTPESTGVGAGGTTSSTTAGGAGGTTSSTTTTGSGGGPVAWPAADAPETLVFEDGVRREIFRVPGAAPPPNPTATSSAATPAELNYTQVLRFRQDTGGSPAVAPRAIVVAMPGFNVGGAGWTGLARGLVKRGHASGSPVEVWAIDRRSNLLEDLRGMDAAQVAKNPEIARGYYGRGETVGGEAYAPVQPETTRFMSEWGMTVHIQDLREVIKLVPQADRKSHVFLVGHSLGAAVATAYAGWEFEDGTRGFDELAGVALLDGALFQSGTLPWTQDDYDNGPGAKVSFGPPGLTAVRGGQTFAPFAQYGLSPAGFALSEVMAMRAAFAPDEVVIDADRDAFVGGSVNLPPGAALPRLTNMAAMAYAFDDQTSLLAFGRTKLGTPRPSDATETYQGLYGEPLVRPSTSDPSATFGWVDAPAATPAESTPVAALARLSFEGRTNYLEWYFPSRLFLDIFAVGAARGQTKGQWQDTQAGLRAYHCNLIDAPILAIPSGLLSPADFDALKTSLPPVGAGRPNAGATRSQPAGFEVLYAAGMAHNDPLVAPDSDDTLNPVPKAVEAFVTANNGAGTVLVAVPKSP